MKYNLFANTSTNYLVVIMRLIQGILTTRWFYEYLGQSQYGYWSLLWSFFIYALLLDFGFSMVVQKFTANKLYERDINKYNDIVGSVFAFQILMALVIFIGSLIAGEFLEFLTRESNPETLIYYKKALYLLGAGTALTYPLGIFNEILTGLHKQYIKNWIIFTGKIVELIGIWLLFNHGGKLLTLIIFTIILNFVITISNFWPIKRNIKDFRLRFFPKWYILKELREFSFYVYLITISNLILLKTDRLVLGIFSGLNSVGIYQLGSRMPELGKQMASQYQIGLAPISAELHGENNLGKLQSILVKSLRFTAFLATGPLLISIYLAPEILQLLFNVSDLEVVRVCQYMMVSSYVAVVFRSVAAKYFLMCNLHRFLAITLICEAVVNLTLSIMLVRKFGVLGVVYGTLAANGLLGVFWYLPKLISTLKLSAKSILTEVYLKPLIGTALGFIVAWTLKKYIFAAVNLWIFMIISAITIGITYLISCGLLMLNKEEKLTIKQCLCRR